MVKFECNGCDRRMELKVVEGGLTPTPSRCPYCGSTSLLVDNTESVADAAKRGFNDTGYGSEKGK